MIRHVIAEGAIHINGIGLLLEDREHDVGGGRRRRGHGSGRRFEKVWIDYSLRSALLKLIS